MIFQIRSPRSIPQPARSDAIISAGRSPLASIKKRRGGNDAGALLAMVGARSRRDWSAYRMKFSGGPRQRIGIARALGARS